MNTLKPLTPPLYPINTPLHVGENKVQGPAEVPDRAPCLARSGTLPGPIGHLGWTLYLIFASLQWGVYGVKRGV